MFQPLKLHCLSPTPCLKEIISVHMTGQSQHSLTGTQMGTPYYMSPEQLRDSKSVDARSDLYSLGVTLYHLATGDHPQTIRLDVLPTRLRTILERALQKHPADRFNSASEMLLSNRKANRPQLSLSVKPGY